MIIYVYPDGNAHTTDQAHDIAYKWNMLLKGGIVEWWQNFAESMRAFVERLYETWKGVIEQFKAMGKTWDELTIDPVERRSNYRQWQQQEQRRPQCIKTYMKNQFDIQKPTDGIRFRRNQRG